MMNDMKLILKVMGCSANKKTGLLFVAVTLAMIVLGIFDRESNMSFVSGVLMVTLASWIPQALMSVDLTHMMAASPKRRRLYSVVMPMLNVFFDLVCFSVSVLLLLWMNKGGRMHTAVAIIIIGMFSLESQVFQAFVFKRNYWLCMIIFFAVAYSSMLVVLLGGMFKFTGKFSFLNFLKGEHAIVIAVLLGYAAVLLGAILYKVANAYNYNRPTQGRSFRGIGGKDPRV